jgi:hypothetical protein
MADPDPRAETVEVDPSELNRLSEALGALTKTYEQAREAMTEPAAQRPPR